MWLIEVILAPVAVYSMTDPLIPYKPLVNPATAPAGLLGCSTDSLADTWSDGLPSATK